MKARNKNVAPPVHLPGKTDVLAAGAGTASRTLHGAKSGRRRSWRRSGASRQRNQNWQALARAARSRFNS